jgi:hypothetical protein
VADQKRAEAAAVNVQSITNSIIFYLLSSVIVGNLLAMGKKMICENPEFENKIKSSFASRSSRRE